MAKKQKIERKFYITLEVELDYIYDYDESKAQRTLWRIANSVEHDNKNDEYYVQHISTVSIVDAKGGMLWARR